ncbi:IclR family transcriptional regulator [Photobacterium sp. ZSDE20]|uniref:HTH-type transcriptional repressor AllR n=1 Tax=Photobacterium pectinilyticum TaxID=2906793 RepID=A0ABT1N635_9GAMM|nr:IclR family transcriptional regulator [Photobacterium sp. ZSDE20]MCQ1060202.1 IclR family transcriptional regulator [Photobacterium sp. ZSDE20]MDD1827637.1 IclR family transcriptional regulator [Photobacterium sp. ZSDE20]
MPSTKSILKGLSILESIARGSRTLTEIHEELGIPKTTVHRTLATLIESNYIRDVKGIGLMLGTEIMRLGLLAQEQMPLRAIARPYLERLANETQDTVHLGIREDEFIFYLDKVKGYRTIEMKSSIGDRLPLACTGIGKSLMLDLPRSEISRLCRTQIKDKEKSEIIINRMNEYTKGDYSFDLEDSTELLRCVAVPIRNKHKNIIAAISLASINVYMSNERMNDLIPLLKNTSRLISRDIDQLS